MGTDPIRAKQPTLNAMTPTKRASRRVSLSFFLTVGLALTSCSRGAKTGAGPRPLTPQESLQSMKLSEDFKVELFLGEPQVMSPVEMAFDENGRVYVAEMLDYPDDPPPGKPARSRVRLLEDADGDGRYERAVVFADKVLQASGLLPWRGGLLVTSAPDILFFQDTDGDGKADVRKVLYTGFPKVNPEARITNLRYGIDNWVYAANNGNDGRVTSPDDPGHPPVLIRGADFRFHPMSGEFEAASGPAQFGSSFDDWGNQFITQNTIHLRHVVLPMRYIARAPLLDVPAYAQDISDHGRPSAPMFPLTGPQQWRIERTALRQHRYQEQGLNRTEQVGGYFTAASGSTVYNGDAFPKEYRGSIFTGDVSGNLVHRDELRPDGATFAASRAKEGVEFLASTDVWFRPCNFANAPDGNLYMMDVYRLFIETPESIPEEIKKGMDFYAGDSLGRIYRIVPKEPRRSRDLKPRLGTASVAELVKHLENTNGWHRQTAQRLLVERQDRAAVPLLRELAERSAASLGRIHALWTLEGLAALDGQLVLRALKDSDPRVREHALRLSEGFLGESPPVRGAVFALTKDPDAHVQLQLAFTLGQMKDQRALGALAELVTQRGSDQWFRLAILSSVNDAASPFFHLLRARHASVENGELLAQLASLIGAKHDPGELTRFLGALHGVKQPEPGLVGLAKALQLTGVRNLQAPGAEAALRKFLDDPAPAVEEAAWEVARHISLPALVEQALADAARGELPPKQRVTAIRALRGGQFAAVRPVLEKLLEFNQAPEIQIAAVESLASFDDGAIAPALLRAWGSYSPGVRAKVLAALLGERDRMKVLLTALEEDRVERTVLDDTSRARLLNHPDPEIAGRAKTFFKPESTDRTQVVASYRDALNLTGDVARGKHVFENQCAKCHLPLRPTGRIGPDLSGISNKTREELLTSILNPSYAIEPRFVNYLITAVDGRVYEGILTQETPSAITLRDAEGDVTILRRKIGEIRTSRLSLMPDGLERGVDRQSMADLIAYLRGGL